MTKELEKSAREWKTEKNPIPLTDHSTVSVKISDIKAPAIGKGRRTFPNRMIKDKPILQFINAQGNEMLQKMRTQERTEQENPQTLWANFKNNIMKYSIRRERSTVPRIDAEIERVSLKIAEIKQDKLDQSPTEKKIDVQIELAELGQYLKELEQKKLTQRKERTKTHALVMNESMNAAWYRLSKEVKPRDVIYCTNFR
jgi:hypothetical protein